MEVIADVIDVLGKLSRAGDAQAENKWTKQEVRKLDHQMRERRLMYMVLVYIYLIWWCVEGGGPSIDVHVTSSGSCRPVTAE